MYRAVVFLFLLTVASACHYDDETRCVLTNGTVVRPDKRTFCCNGQIIPKVLNGQRQCCCKDTIHAGAQEVYNPQEHICCYGGKFPKTDSLGRTQRCCGPKPYVKVRGNLCCIPGPFDNAETARLYTSLVGENDTCCGNEKYDERTKVCCKDDNFTVTLYTRDHTKQCCQREYINQATHECALNRTTGRLTHMLGFIRPCGNDQIDNREDLCCNGHPHRDVSPISSYSCCGDRILNINTHRCCNNSHEIPRNMQCCGSHPNGINPRTHRCCGSVPVEISNDTDQCCGAVTIDTATHHCCNGKAYDKSTFKICRGSNKTCSPAGIFDKCCGGEKLNSDSVCCKAGTMYNYRYFQTQKKRTSHNKCCTSYIKSSTSAIPYSDQTEECHQGHKPKVSQKQDRPRCGKTYFDDNIDLCCNNILYRDAARDGHECCQYNIFDPATQSCCVRGRVYNSTSCPDFRCGNRIYVHNSEICCGGRIHLRYPGRVCCGKQTINPSEQTCCDSKVVTNPNRCHMKPEHPICEWLCEQDDKKLRRKIPIGKIDICKTNAYVARVSRTNNIRDVTRIQLVGEKNRLYHHNQNQNSLKVKKLFHPTCVCDQSPRKEVRRKIVVITDKSIRDTRVDLTDSDYILPYTTKIRKTLMKYWKERCNTPASLVTADVVDEIFDFIKVKIEKQKKAKFYES